MTDLKCVKLVFENCNTVNIDAKDVVGLFLDEITYSIWVGSPDQYFKHYSAKKAWMSFKLEALDTTTHFNFYSEHFDERSTFRYHLDNYHDITHVELVGVDGSTEYISVPWSPDPDAQYSNPWEKVAYEENRVIIEFKEE